MRWKQTLESLISLSSFDAEDILMKALEDLEICVCGRWRVVETSNQVCKHKVCGKEVETFAALFAVYIQLSTTKLIQAFHKLVQVFFFITNYFNRNTKKVRKCKNLSNTWEFNKQQYFMRLLDVSGGLDSNGSFDTFS